VWDGGGAATRRAVTEQAERLAGFRGLSLEAVDIGG
jgi:hypothetical protein